MDEEFFALMADFYKHTNRQGPGSDEETVRALSMTGLASQPDLQIADIGCGTGAQTFALAQQVQGHITAVDLFPDFLETLTERATALGLQQRISPQVGSMDALPFEENSFDLIWSEGAIYNIGFEKGVNQWKQFLKSGGYLAVSEITWTTATRPKEIEEFWQKEYPEVDTASNKMKILEESGYSPVGYFYLAESSWVDNFYRPLGERTPLFLETHQHSAKAKEIVTQQDAEFKLYLQYKSYYSYGFYIAKKL